MEFVTSNVITELHSSGWSNKGMGEGRVKSRIDRALGNSTWMEKKGHLHVKYLNPALSDHCPFLLRREAISFPKLYG